MSAAVEKDNSHEEDAYHFVVFFRSDSERVDHREQDVGCHLVEELKFVYERIFERHDMCYVAGCDSGQDHRDGLL
jgi:hypothetical protein